MIALVLMASICVAGVLEEEPHWKKASAHFDAFRYDEAYAELQRVLDAQLSDAERVRVRLRMGHIAADLDRETEARDDFRRALEIDIEAKLGADAGPTPVRLLEEERARLRAERARVEPERREAPPPAPPDSPDPPIEPALVVAGVGAGLAAVGGLTWLAGVLAYVAIENSAGTQREVAEGGERAAWAQLAGQGAVVVGLVTAGVGGAVWLASRPE